MAYRVEPIVKGFKGVMPPWSQGAVHAPPEKGMQVALAKFGQPLEGRTRSGSPFKLTFIKTRKHLLIIMPSICKEFSSLEKEKYKKK